MQTKPIRRVLAVGVSALALGPALLGCDGDDADISATPTTSPTTSVPAAEVSESAPAASAPPPSIPWCDIDRLDDEVDQFGQHDAAIRDLMEHAERFTEETGTWHDVVGVDGSRSPAQIQMEDLSEAGTLAERIGLPGPYDELCIHPEERQPPADY